MQPAVVISPHPFLPLKDREIVFAEFQPGETIGQYLRRQGLTSRFGLDGRRPVVCTIQGYRVPFEMWPHIRPKSGYLVEFHAAVRGGGDGNKLGRTLGTILIAVASYYTGGLVAAEYGAMMGAAATAATTIVGGLALNAIFPPPKPHIANEGDTSPTYAVEGGSNQMRRYEPMVKIIGTHKVFPDMGAQPYNEFQGEDQFGYYIFDLGYNDVELSDMKIGDTPLESYTGVAYEISEMDGVLNLFPGNVDSVAGEALTAAASWIQRTSSANATQLAVEVTGYLFQISPQGDIWNNTVTIELNYRKVGSSTWLKLTQADDSIPFLIDWRAVPASLAQALRDYLLNLSAPDGEITIQNSSRKPLRRTFVWPVAKGQYEVRVRRVSAESTDEKFVSEVIWSQLRTYQPDTVDYTGRKRIALKVRATGQISGQLPAFSCIARAKTQVFGAAYLSLPATGGNYASTQDSVVLDALTANLDIRVKVRVTDWTGADYQVFIAKDTGADPGRVFGLYISNASSGELQFFRSVAGVAQFASGGDLVPGFANGSMHWIGVKHNATSGAVTFWKSDDYDPVTEIGTWVQIGSTKTLATGTIDTNNAAVTIGTVSGANYLLGGEVHYAEVRSDIDGPIVAKFDPGDGLPDATLFVSQTTGEVWTINQSGSPTADLVEVPGQWPIRQTSNPAWWYLNTLRGQLLNGRRIWGANASESAIDVENIRDFADWCDSQGLTVDMVLDQQMSVFDVLQAIALMGRGTPSWGSGKMGAVWDAPNLPVTAVFGMHNIVAGSFQVVYTTEDLADIIEGEFINPALDWQRDYVRVAVPEATGQANVRRVQLFGRTNKELAAEDTNLYAATNAYRNRGYKWTSDWEAMPSARGDVVQLSHDLASLDYSGRLMEGSTSTSLKLPRQVPLYAGGSFIVIIKPDGTYATYSVNGGTGNTDTLTPTSALPFSPDGDTEHPPYDYRWLYGPTSTPGKKVKIDSLRPIDERFVEVSAVDELPIFYTAKDNPYTYVPPRPIFGATPVIKSLTLTPDGQRAGQGYVVRVAIDWQIEGRFSFTDVRVAVGGNPFFMLAREMKGTSTEITIADRQDVTVEITVYSDLGRVGSTAKASVSQFIDFTGLRVPGDAPGFFISGKVFTWKAVDEADVIGYQIRFHLGDKRTWEDALPLHEGVITEHDWEAASLPLDDLRTVYLIKAIDAAGQESANAAAIVRGLGDAGLANVIEVIDFANDGWPGTITNGTIVVDEIQADTSTLFYGPDDGAPFYSASDADIFYPASLFKDLTFESNVIVPEAPLFGSIITVQHVMQGDPHYLEWKQDGIGPLYSLSDTDLIYTADADPFYDGSSEYLPWTGARVIEPGDRYIFRLKAGGGALQGIFSELLVSIDAPDMEEELNNVVISGSGTRLPITKDFTSIKSVQGTLESIGGTAVTFTIEDRDPDLGPLIKARDKDLAAVAGQGDFRVKGW